MRCGESPQENLERALEKIEAAARGGARVVCLQELFRSQYPCQQEDPARFELAEPIPGPTTDALAKLAGSRSVAIVASLFERRAAGLYHNTAVAIDEDGRLLGLYRKMHIPDDPLYYEKFYFTPGDLGFRSFETRSARTPTNSLISMHAMKAKGPSPGRSRPASRPGSRAIARSRAARGTETQVGRLASSYPSS